MHRFTHIHQFHPGTSVGDAVTHDMLETQRVLRRAGFHSEVFAEHIAAGLEGRIHPLSSYRGDAAALLLVHHSMGFDGFADVVRLPDRKLLRYHNITPAHYFDAPYLAAYSHKGRDQLGEYLRYVEFALGDSAYNCEELTRVGYKYVRVLPILFDPAPVRERAPDRATAAALRGSFNLLFVGRICRNKRQADLVRIFAHYHHHDPAARLFLVGSWDGNEAYLDEIRREIVALGLTSAVSLPGKVPPSQLVAYYRHSDVFLCASVHEGFCVPLLEAMAFDLPVIARRTTAVPETLGPGGILLDDADPEAWAGAIECLRSNTARRGEVLRHQRTRLASLHIETVGRTLLEFINELEGYPSRLENVKPTVQIQGPFETSYSLATVNRRLALALDEEGTFDVSIYCTEGPGDYSPDAAQLADKPRAAWLWQKSALLARPPDIVIRNLYPPRVEDSPGAINLLWFAWEESRIPPAWVERFNRSLDAAMGMSSYVASALRASGVTVPVHVLHPGIDPLPGERGRRGTAGPFTFLSITSGFPRKGADILLEAFFSEFDGSEDVCLLIKTFPNVHNAVAQQLAAWRGRTTNPPRCVHHDADLPAAAIERLYQQAHCAVYPTRGEGFGLPIAEAMIRRLPVIVTAHGGHMDFCSGDSAFLIEHQKAPSRSHFGVPGSEWAEPDVQHLRAAMRFVFDHRDSDAVARRVENAYQGITSHFRWSQTAKRLLQILNHCIATPRVDVPAARLAMVSSWDARCGIAEYSRYLLEALQRVGSDLQPVVLSSPGEGVWPHQPVPSHVCWNNWPFGDLQALREYVLASTIEVIHFQFNFGFFALADLATTLEQFKRRGRRTVVTLHSTADTRVNGTILSLAAIAEQLRGVDLILVHSKPDQDRLRSMGIAHNVRLFPHGTLAFPTVDTAAGTTYGIPFTPVVGTFGFLLPHKGLLELLAALGILREEFPTIGLLAQCALHRDPIATRFEQVVRKRIADLALEKRVLLSTQFLDPEEANLFLQCADLLVLPYKDTQESSSAAVRFALGAGRPVITTALDVFDDVSGATYRIPSPDPASIAAAVRTLLRNPPLAETFALRARNCADATNWDSVAQQYQALLRDLSGRPTTSCSDRVETRSARTEREM